MILDHLNILIAPLLVTPLMVLSSLFWISWWILVSISLGYSAKLEGM